METLRKDGSPAPGVEQDVLRRLQAVLGEGHARRAGPEDQIDGVQAQLVAYPETVEQASEVMRVAHEAGLAVSPRGGGTKVAWGNRPKRADLILSTERLNRVLEHAAGDLVVRAEAGARLSEVQKVLASAGQRLALDPPEAGATLGGVVVTDASGPLRHRFGTVRDLLIGITYILPDGTVARAGGKVVKNVAGYDLCKLFTGSLGTLGLVVETIFRLHPLPGARQWVTVSRFGGHDDLGAAVQRLMHSSLVPSAVEMAWGEGGTLMVLFEGVEPGVAAQVEEARALLGHGREVHVGHDLYRPWREMGRMEDRVAETGTVQVKISAPPAELPAVLTAARSAIGRRLGHRILGHAAIGITTITLSGDDRLLIECIEDFRQRIGELGGFVVVQEASPAVKEAVDAWGPVGDGLPLMQRVKAAFDPGSLMNPGRFAGGL